MTLKVVGMDAELNSLSNGGIFQGVIGQKIGFSPQTHPIPLMYPADIRSETLDDSKSGWDGCRIKFSIEWWYFQGGGGHRAKNRFFT